MALYADAAAKQAFDRALAINPDSAAAKEGIATLRKRGFTG